MERILLLLWMGLLVEYGLKDNDVNTVFSYFLIYKRSLIEANQKQYICTFYQKTMSIIQNIVQIFILFLTRNYILYLIVMIVCNIMTNVCISWKADRMYPWLKKDDKSMPDKAERTTIYKNTLAMSMHKLGTVCVNSSINYCIKLLSVRYEADDVKI